MEELEKVISWLKTYPGWEGTLHVDVTDNVPGSSGLYPKGLQELSRREDVLGNLCIRYRWSFSLHRVAAQNPQDNAKWLMAFQQWVAHQSIQGKTPVFGDDPRQEIFRAGEGTLISRNAGGSTGYTVLLTADFTKIFRGE